MITIHILVDYGEIRAIGGRVSRSLVIVDDCVVSCFHVTISLFPGYCSGKRKTVDEVANGVITGVTIDQPRSAAYDGVLITSYNVLIWL